MRVTSLPIILMATVSSFLLSSHAPVVFSTKSSMQPLSIHPPEQKAICHLSLKGDRQFLSSEISKGRGTGSILSPAGCLLGDLRQVVFPYSTSVSPLLQLISMMEDMGIFFSVLAQRCAPSQLIWLSEPHFSHLVKEGQIFFGARN